MLLMYYFSPLFLPTFLCTRILSSCLSSSDVQWSRPQIRGHSELWLEGLQLSRTFHTSVWPLEIA